MSEGLSTNLSRENMSAQRSTFIESQLDQITNSSGFDEDIFTLEQSNSPQFGFTIHVSLGKVDFLIFQNQFGFPVLWDMGLLL